MSDDSDYVSNKKIGCMETLEQTGCSFRRKHVVVCILNIVYLKKIVLIATRDKC